MGLQIAERLQSQQAVIGIVRSDQSLHTCNDRGIDCIRLDLDQLEAVNQYDMDVEQHSILYLAPPPRQGERDTRLQNFLQALGPQRPKKIVLISTTGVYGDCEGRWVDESTPLNPQVDRAKRRLDAEQQLQSWCQQRQLSWVILRVPGIYGPGKLPLQRISSGEPIVRQEDSPYSNRIHAYDLASICIQAVMDEAITGIYNCADGHPSTMYDYFMKVAQATGLPAPEAISLQQARTRLSAGMLSYMAESRRIGNEKLRRDFKLELRYPDITAGLADISQP
jgi:nucleoside-diphosphate-sugar epimerase